MQSGSPSASIIERAAVEDFDEAFISGCLTGPAKAVLALAWDEAEHSRGRYIGTEHLLLGLLRQGEGLAAKVLHNLGVEINKVRATIESVLGRNEREGRGSVILGFRAKKALSLAAAEAVRTDCNYVATEHLLFGILLEGEGVAAHLLGNMGANLETVHGEIDRLLSTV